MTRKQNGKLSGQISRAIFSYAMFRIESAIIIAMTILFVWLAASNVSWFPGEWWFWLLFGLAGEMLIVITTLRDPNVHRKVGDSLFKRRFDARKVRTPELRQKVEKALEYRQLVIQEIEREEDAVLDDHLMNMTRGLEDWIAQIYKLAQGLDAYGRDPIIAKDMDSVPAELKRFQRMLSEATSETLRNDLQKTVTLKKRQWAAQQRLRETISRAQLQLEDTLTALGTVYTQVKLLGSKDVHSGRAQRLQQDIVEQVHQLEDVSSAMNEVYQASRSA